MPGIAVLAVVAFLLGQRMGGIGDPAVDASATSAAAPFARDPMSLGDSRAPDISQMSPDERAARLFNRIMTYGAAGKLDSARMFAPMAMQAYEMLGTLDPHNRYDMGMIAVVTGDVAVAAAEADTILKASPSHLLGLILAMKSAGLRQDAAARKALEKRFVAASGPERAKGLKEYAEHASDIDAALKLSATSRP